MTANHTSLKRALSEHQPHQLMRLIVILILRASTSNISKRGVSCKYNQWIINGSKVRKLSAFKIIISLQVKWIMSVKSLPFMCNFVESLCCEVSLYTIVLSSRFKSRLNVFYWSLNCLLDSLESVKNIESKIVSKCFG